MKKAKGCLILILIFIAVSGCISQDGLSAGKSPSQFSEGVNASQEYFDQMVALDPTNATAWCTRGMYYNNAFGQYEKALDNYNKGLELDSKNGLCWYAKGVTLRNMKQIEESDVCFRNAKTFDPSIVIR
ncbi:MAG: tetratricopeptide repeat protein [Methanoregula sp.]|jgi:tetratricopeptide (TPR) repeat protein